MKRERNPESKRRKIIAATHKILREGGYFTNFSLDSVAREAGVSKGGLMHHFASKDALLRAAAQDAIDQFEGRFAARLADEQAAGDMSRAYVEAAFEERGFSAELSPILLSYLNSEGDSPSRFEAWQSRSAADGIDTVTATLIRLVADGLLYTELIDNQPIDATLRKQLKARLLEMLNAASE